MYSGGLPALLSNSPSEAYVYFPESEPEQESYRYDEFDEYRGEPSAANRPLPGEFKTRESSREIDLVESVRDPVQGLADTKGAIQYRVDSIYLTQPRTELDANRSLFDLARRLKILSRDPEDQRQTVLEWYYLATSRGLKMLPWQIVWDDFVSAYDKARRFFGETLRELAIEAELDEFVCRPRAREVNRLFRLFRAVARYWRKRGKDTFPLSYDMMAKSIGSDPRNIQKTALSLTEGEAPILEIVEAGISRERGKATIWRVLGPID